MDLCINIFIHNCIHKLLFFFLFCSVHVLFVQHLFGCATLNCTVKQIKHCFLVSLFPSMAFIVGMYRWFFKVKSKHQNFLFTNRINMRSLRCIERSNFRSSYLKSDEVIKIPRKLGHVKQSFTIMILIIVLIQHNIHLHNMMSKQQITEHICSYRQQTCK